MICLILGPYSPSSTLISVDAVMSTSISDSCSIDGPEEGTVHPVLSCLTKRKWCTQMQDVNELVQQPEGQGSAQLEAILGDKRMSDINIPTVDDHAVDETNKFAVSRCHRCFQGCNIDNPLSEMGASCSENVLSQRLQQEMGTFAGPLSLDLECILRDVKAVINQDCIHEGANANWNLRENDNNGNDLLDILLNQTELQLSASPTHELLKSATSKNHSSSWDFKPVTTEAARPSISMSIFPASIPTSTLASTHFHESHNNVHYGSFLGYNKLSEQRQRWDWQIAGTGTQSVGSYCEPSPKTILNPTSSDAIPNCEHLAYPSALAGPTLLDIESALALMNRSKGIMDPMISSTSSVSSSLGEGYDEETSRQKAAGEATNSDHKSSNALSTDRGHDNMQKFGFWGKIQKRNPTEPRDTLKIRSNVDSIDDGYRWRKYGQKAIKNSPYPRSYYRCTSNRCSVKRQVERSTEDPGLFLVSYDGIHLHHRPNPLSSLQFHIIQKGEELCAVPDQTYSTSSSKTLDLHPNISGTRSSSAPDLLLDNLMLKFNNPDATAECVADCNLFPSNADSSSKINHGLLESLVPAQLLQAVQGSK